MITVVKADQAELDVRPGLSELFADGFKEWLGYFSKDPKKLAAAFAHMFVLDQFYVALLKGQVIGMAACTNGTSLSVKLNKQQLRKHLGWYKGTLAGVFLKKEFETPFVHPSPGVGSIEFVGTASEFRGQGVATQLIRHILEHSPYEVYLIEEVADTNMAAIKLYNKLGFEEYKRREIPSHRAKKIGINHIVSLRLSKQPSSNA